MKNGHTYGHGYLHVSDTKGHKMDVNGRGRGGGGILTGPVLSSPNSYLEYRGLFAAGQWCTPSLVPRPSSPPLTQSYHVSDVTGRLDTELIERGRTQQPHTVKLGGRQAWSF